MAKRMQRIGIFTIFAAKLHSLALSFTERSDL
jgi:hypothetical protein